MLVSKLDYTRLFMVFGSVFGPIGSGLFITFGLDTTTGKWIGFQIVCAVGSGLSSLTPLMIV